MILPGTGRGTAAEGRGGGGSPQARRPATDLARKLRRAKTLPEVLLWEQLRGNRAGFKVRRQHPLGAYVADFFVREARLVIEIDGAGAHDGDQAADRRFSRDRWMRDNGYSALHLAASDVLENMEGTLHMIAARVASPLHQPPAGPPPPAGEDRA